MDVTQIIIELARLQNRVTLSRLPSTRAISNRCDNGLALPVSRPGLHSTWLISFALARLILCRDPSGRRPGGSEGRRRGQPTAGSAGQAPLRETPKAGRRSARPSDERATRRRKYGRSCHSLRDLSPDTQQRHGRNTRRTGLASRARLDGLGRPEQERAVPHVTRPDQERRARVADLVQHMTDDKPVLWAWNPGRGRTPPCSPSTMAAAGAPCPNLKE